MILNNCIFTNNTAYTTGTGARGLITYILPTTATSDFIATVNITNMIATNNTSPTNTLGSGLAYFLAPTLIVNIIGGTFRNNQQSGGFLMNSFNSLVHPLSTINIIGVRVFASLLSTY